MSMDNLDNVQRIKPNVARLIANARFELGRTKPLIAVSAMIGLAAGGWLFVNYPLETIIVLIFAISVVSMSRT